MMLTKEKITDILSEKSEYLAEAYGVKKIGLFGSYANGTHTEASDIDIIVEFETPLGFKFMEFADYLEELLGKPVGCTHCWWASRDPDSIRCSSHQGKYRLCPIEQIKIFCLIFKRPYVG